MTWHQQRRAHRRHRCGPRHGFGPWGGPFARTGRFFGAGEVRLALLSLLEEAPRHGYELMKGLEERSHGTYRASAGTVYPTLQQLEDEGLVSSQPAEGKRVYALSDAGRAELERERETVDEIWQRADEWGSWAPLWEPAAAELLRPAMQLVKTAMRSLARSDDPHRVDAIREILTRARHEIRDLAGD
jgi:DNA-binding PadR family transcriptional regulator